MATTRIWAVKSRPDHVLDYAMNPDKTINPDWSNDEFQTMRDVMDYAMDDYKTEHQYYVTAINCNEDCAREQMRLTKQQFGKTNGILAYHGYQSFAEGEVDADTAHKIGVELAKELWPEYQVIVATHLNTHCFHNHFVVNSVSFVHGKKFNACKESYRKMRSASDILCKQYGLLVITEKKAYYPKHYAEWEAEQNGGSTWRSVIRVDVDKAVKASMTWSAFLRNLQQAGYEIKTNVKYIAIRPQGKERFVRLRSLGENYTEEAIRQRILRQRVPERPPRPETLKVLQARVYGDFHLSKVTWKGLRALYFFYLYRLRQVSRLPQEQVPYMLREDLRKLNALTEQARLLHRYRIDTREQLADTADSISKRIELLCGERQTLNNEKRRTGISKERAVEISKRVTDIGGALKSLRRERWLCERIEERSILLQEKLKQIAQQEKEADNNVPTRRSSRADRQYGDQCDGKRR